MSDAENALTPETVRRLLSKCTPGPWHMRLGGLLGNPLICSEARHGIALAQTVGRPWEPATEHADAKLMALANALALAYLEFTEEAEGDGQASADETPAAAQEPEVTAGQPNEDARALMTHHERLAAASRQEARVAPNAAEVLELLAQAIEARRDRQKCGTSFDDLVEQLDPAHIRSLIRPARAPRWVMAAR